MDLCTDAGFSFLGYKRNRHVLRCLRKAVVNLRLAIWLILCGEENRFLLIIAIICTSFCSINKASNKRDALTPYGDTGRAYVAQGNLLLERYLGSYRCQGALLSCTIVFYELLLPN